MASRSLGSRGLQPAPEQLRPGGCRLLGHHDIEVGVALAHELKCQHGMAASDFGIFLGRAIAAKEHISVHGLLVKLIEGKAVVLELSMKCCKPSPMGQSNRSAQSPDRDARSAWVCLRVSIRTPLARAIHLSTWQLMPMAPEMPSSVRMISSTR